MRYLYVVPGDIRARFSNVTFRNISHQPQDYRTKKMSDIFRQAGSFSTRIRRRSKTARKRIPTFLTAFGSNMPTQMNAPVLETEIPGWSVRRGKVRDCYDLGDKMLLVSSDRISAFDWVLPSGIPDKGRVLTQVSTFWFEQLGEAHHMLSTEVADFGLPGSVDADALAGRSMLVRKTQVAPIECVVRGYLSGSGWKEYKQSETVCGIKLPSGLKESDQ